MRRRTTLLAAASLLTHAAHAETFPDRPLKLLVPYPAGDGPDVLGRSLAEALRPRLGDSGPHPQAQHLRRSRRDKG